MARRGGYLRFESTINFQALDQAALTEKAFLRLTGTIPDAFAGLDSLPPSVRRVQSSLAHQLREALREAASERLAQLTRQLFDRPLPERS